MTQKLQWNKRTFLFEYNLTLANKQKTLWYNEKCMVEYKYSKNKWGRLWKKEGKEEEEESAGRLTFKRGNYEQPPK